MTERYWDMPVVCVQPSPDELAAVAAYLTARDELLRQCGIPAALLENEGTHYAVVVRDHQGTGAARGPGTPPPAAAADAADDDGGADAVGGAPWDSAPRL